MSDTHDVFRVQNYYPLFAHCSMPATFAFLRDPEIEALAARMEAQIEKNREEKSV